MTCRSLFHVVLGWIACGLLAASGRAAELPPTEKPLSDKITIASGPFQPTWQSLKQYQCPEWFRDAKFGIWAVWGPESVPEQGDWYARDMYIQGNPQYEHHLKTFGHPSKHGYKDIIALWKAENWDPDRLMSLYKAAGAKYFVAIANHHDNFDCWNSKFHEWNSVRHGPHRDIVGRWKQAALEQGLRFGVTEHNARSYSWLQTSHGSDKTGPMAGVPYDGNDPQYRALYHPPFADSGCTYPVNPPESWVVEWFQRSRDLLDSYRPDLFYFDGGYPFGAVGRSLVAHFYNANTKWHDGRLEAVMNVKDIGGHGDYVGGTCVQDIERGVVAGINPLPWQTDTCIGSWYYAKGIHYKSPGEVVRLLADIVSKNGNLLLNIPLKADGTLDAVEESVLKGIGAWMNVNGEAIYGTRPWQVYGEGEIRAKGGAFQEQFAFSAKDIRFTTKGEVLYAIALGWPADGKLRIRALAAAAGKIRQVSLLGSREPLVWSQQDHGLAITLPEKKPCEHALVLKILGDTLHPVRP
jgi:alpha-L-fucosidase